MTDPAKTLAEVCELLACDLHADAGEKLRSDYPFKPLQNAGRRYTPYQSLKVFMKDGFVDRYSGQRLVNPAVLRLISSFLPEEFPAHPNWKQSESHIGFWELFPTIDHLIPVARGGADEASNWVTASMLKNGAKSNALLEEIGWTLHPPGTLSEWDGLSSWLLTFREKDENFSSVAERHRAYIKRWAAATSRAFNTEL